MGSNQTGGLTSWLLNIRAFPADIPFDAPETLETEIPIILILWPRIIRLEHVANVDHNGTLNCDSPLRIGWWHDIGVLGLHLRPGALISHNEKKRKT